GHIVKIRRDPWATGYTPTVRFLSSHASASTVIEGPSELFYGLGEGYRLVDDSRLGQVTGLVPEIVLEDHIHDPGPQVFDGIDPSSAQYTRRMLSHFHLAAQYGDYRILIRTEPACTDCLKGQ